MRDFMECDKCAAKSGTPRLCDSCLNNRDAISQRDGLLERLHTGIRILKETLKLI